MRATGSGGVGSHCGAAASALRNPVPSLAGRTHVLGPAPGPAHTLGLSPDSHGRRSLEELSGDLVSQRLGVPRAGRNQVRPACLCTAPPPSCRTSAHCGTAPRRLISSAPRPAALQLQPRQDGPASAGAPPDPFSPPLPSTAPPWVLPFAPRWPYPPHSPGATCASGAAHRYRLRP